MKSILYGICLFLCLTAFGNAQNYTVSGQVSGAAGYKILSGVNIYILDTALGATSDAKGYYKINGLPAGSYTIVYSYIGYAEKQVTVTVSADTTLNVSLKQTILDGPIVTTIATQAQNRESAVTFSSINKKDLQKRRTIQDIPELLSDLPSTTFYSDGGNGVGYNYISIRGFGQRRISVLVNGIPQNDPEDHNNYWHNYSDLTSNIQTIQVQRGAGNAFYGPPAIGGSINIKTDHFSPELKLDASFGMGSFNTQKTYFALNSGLLADKYILYGRFSKIESDGYRDRSWVDFTTFFLGAARYDDNSNLRIHFYGGPVKDGLSYNGLPKFFNEDSKKRKYNWTYFGLDENGKKVTYFGERRKDEVENFNQPHLEVLHEWQLSKRFTLNNNFFYVKGYGHFDYDGSWGSESYFRLTPEFGYSVDSIPGDALIRAYVDNDQIGWLPQLTVKTEKGTMLFGAELRHHRSLHWGRLQKGSGLPNEVVGNGARRYYEYSGGKDIASVYFHQNYKWFKDVTLQADLQYVWKRYSLFDEKFIKTDFEVPYNFINPRIGINYNLSPEAHTYLSLYSTTREPRLKNLYDAAEASNGSTRPQFKLNADSSYNFDKPLVKPEVLTGVELGFGFTQDNYKAAVNLYYMNFQDEIIKSGQIDRFGQPITGNAEKTIHYGIELSGSYTPFPQISFNGNLSYSKNELKKYSQFESGNKEIVLDGNPIAGFPDLLANARVNYHWQQLFASLAFKYVGESYTDNFKNAQNKLDAFYILNLDVNYNLATLGMEMVTLQARVNNLLDKQYLAFGEGNAFFPAAGRNFFTTIKISL